MNDWVFEDFSRSARKVIAVHLNYRSRAAQRGRVPEHPSYFFKPPSSLAPNGQPIVRPAGTELLAFEGEIAIILDSPVRQASLAQARAAIGFVTAANDFGLYDFRSADKGSNVRSKGGDGFTPLGPKMIPAQDVDLNALRVRTWVNDDLVQEDVSADLLFPFEQLVADLSQMMTLEAGDIILTGTPAGSTVVQPGDVVTVEVDAPDSPGSPTSGRLVTPVEQGDTPFGAVGSQPSVTDAQRRDAYGIADVTPEPSPDWETLLGDLGTAPVSSELRDRGFVDIFIDGVHPLRPGQRMIGEAATLRMIAFRPDLFKKHGGGYNAQKRAFDGLQPGQVLVIEGRADTTAGTLGDILAIRAATLGAAGVVTDGCVRDSEAFDDINLPVFSAGRHPSVLGRRHVPWEADVTVTCGGASVQPGDVIVGDSDGVIVIPRDIAEDVIAGARRREDQDQFIARHVREGVPVKDIFPMNADWRARYETEQ